MKTAKHSKFRIIHNGEVKTLNGQSLRTRIYMYMYIIMYIYMYMYIIMYIYMYMYIIMYIYMYMYVIMQLLGEFPQRVSFASHV